MQKRLTAEEQDIFFQEIIRKMPGITEPGKLEELSLLALSMMLRRPADNVLLDELIHQVKDVMAEVKPGHTPEAVRNEMRFAARGCIKVLQAAKERRLPRHKQSESDNWAQSDGKTTFHATHHQTEDEVSDNKVARWVAIAAAVLVLGGGVAWWSSGDAPASDGSETSKFVDQIVAAAQGDAPANHMFGGPLKVISMGGVAVVTASGVPPRICAASGMKLVKKGLLSVNGVTPTRVSSAIITELCNKEDGDATIMWAPK